MIRHARRRRRNIAALLLVAALTAVLSIAATTALQDTARCSGWTLFVAILFLTLYNVRKKLPAIPLGSAAHWLQLHIYVGLLTALLFAIHVSWRMPDGVIERLLALLYAVVFLSGLFGLAVSRSFAKRLATRGNEVVFEQIQTHRRQLQSRVEEQVLQCSAESDSTSLARFYAARLQPFFSQMRHFRQHMLQSSRPRRTLLRELAAFQRHLNEQEKQTAVELADSVGAKDDLDYQYALQAVLKCWLFVHVPLTYSLLAFAGFHLFLVSAFAGGAIFYFCGFP